MSIQLQLRRGTTAEHLVFTGANGELTINTTTKRPHVHDGSTAGGAPLAFLSDITNVVPKTEVQSVLYTLARNDVYVRAFNASAQTITVPNNDTVAYPIGTQITIVQVGTGATTLSPGTGVVLNYGDTLTCRKQWSAITITKVATNVWDVIGDVRVN